MEIISVILITTLVIAIITAIISLVVILSKTGKFPANMIGNSYYAPVSDDGFNGTSISELAQPNAFYSNKHDDTLKYLSYVYPAGKDSLSKLTPLQLASFYNSLTFYYNCNFQYQDNDLGVIPGELGGKWDPLSCKQTHPLPYPPQGYFYNFWTYQKYNIPFVYSDSDDSKEYLKLSNFGNCRPGLAFNTYVSGKKGGIRAGPGMFWVNCRTIQRHVWYPNGFINDKSDWEYADNWKTAINEPIPWNYPLNWVAGRKDNEYLEITHFEHIPGMTTSPGWWYNGFAGTGIFVNLGKTVRFSNKIDGVFGLATLLSQTTKGKNLLEKFFKTTDPYIILYGFLGKRGYDANKGIMYCQTDIVPCQYGVGVDADKGITREAGMQLESDFVQAVIKYQNSHGIPDTQPTYEGIKMAIDAARYMTDFNLYRFSVQINTDEPMFFFAINLGYDTVQLPTDPNSNGYFVLEILDVRVPDSYKAKVLNRDYSDMINIASTPTDPVARLTDLNLYSQTYNQKYLTDSFDFFTKNHIFTQRDPLFINDDSKAQVCNGFKQVNSCPSNPQNGEWLNIFCDGNMSADYKCLSAGVDATGEACTLTGNNMTC